MSNETHVCTTCAEATPTRATLVVVDKAGRCAVCGSDAVLPAAVFLSLLEKEQKTKQTDLKSRTAPSGLGPSEATRNRIDSLATYYKPIRDFLQRNKLVDIDLWWDGYAFSEESSGHPNDPDDAPAEGQFEWVQYTFKNASGEYKTLVCYFDPQEESRFEISDVKKDKI